MLRPCVLRTLFRRLAAPALVLALLASLLSTPPNAAAASAPSVKKISVTSGPVKGGTVVVITGKNFSKITSVKFGGRAAKYKVNSTTRITATAPARTAGSADVRVSGKSGTSAVTAAARFRYVAPPAVTALRPASGTALGGTAVTVTGTDFRSVKAVSFGGVKATKITVVSATTLVATAPAHVAGSADVTVSTGYGTSKAGSKSRFGYLPVPTVTTSTLPLASAGVRYSVRLAGAKGTAPYRWKASGLPTGLTLSSDGTITGLITKAPEARKSGSVLVTVTDAKGLTASRTLSLTVQPSSPAIIGTVGQASVGMPYEADLITADGRDGTWSATGLPAGITLDGATLRGTASTPQNASLTLTFTDRAGQTATRTLVLAVITPDPSGLQDLGACNTTLGFDDSDDASGAIALKNFAIDFGGTQHTVFVSPNGYVTFGSGVSIAGPFALEDFPAPVIAPFLADTDTSRLGSGRVSWGLTDTQLCVTWTNMGYWDQGFDKTNTFQLILTTRPERGAGAFDATFNYGQIQWDAGDNDGGVDGLAASGALAARAGWATGLGAPNPRSFELAGSGVGGSLITNGPSSLVTRSTDGTPGRYTYRFGGR